MYNQSEHWPVEELILDETIIFSERKRSGSKSQIVNSVNKNCQQLKPGDNKEHSEHSAAVTLLLNPVDETHCATHPWYITSSSYVKTIRVVAWVRRFMFNCQMCNSKQTGIQTVQEFLDAEMVVIRTVQLEEFLKQGDVVRGLVVTKATDGLFHVKTKLTYRKDDAGICLPVLLPSCHPLVTLLIRW